MTADPDVFEWDHADCEGNHADCEGNHADCEGNHTDRQGQARETPTLGEAIEVMNHVPDEATAAIARFGDSVLYGAPEPVRTRLRSDLRLRIEGGESVAETGVARVSFHIAHRRIEPTLRDYGPFVTTIVDGVDESLREWGVEPPTAYEYDADAGVDAATGGDADGWLVFAGRSRVLSLSP